MPSILPIAAAASDAGDISGQVGLGISSGLVNEIVASIQGIRVNKQTAVILSGRIRDLADGLASLAEHPEFKMDWGACGALNSFERILTDVRDALHSISGRNHLSQMVNERKDRERLLDLSERVRNAFRMLVVQMRARVEAQAKTLSTQLTDMTERHERELQALTESLYEPYVRVPPRPLLHFGRDAEVETVVDAIDGSPGRIAILGGPGMGKTTLAVAVLHSPSVIARYGSKRLFVPCDAAEGHSGFLSTLVTAFGISGTDRKLTQLKLRELIGSDPALLVLDNFESAWERDSQRADAENVLGSLDSVDTLSLVITLRGAERPRSVRWTRPLMQTLSPLSNSAALQVFASIANTPDRDSRTVQDLLSCLDGVPLAIILMANLAQVETVDALRRQWHQVKTAMLLRGDGQQRLTCLDISIQLSLQSPRMQAVPGGKRLLSLLSLLPYGAAEGDTRMWSLTDPLGAVAALLRTSLAIRRGERLFVLAPIRAFMTTNYPPSDDDIAPFCTYYFDLAEIARSAVDLTFDADLFSTMGMMRPAIEHASHALILRKAVSHDTNLVSLCVLAEAHAAMGDNESATEAFARLEPTVKTSQLNLGDRIYHLQAQAFVATYAGDTMAALALSHAALGLARTCYTGPVETTSPTPLHVAASNMLLADVQLEAGNTWEAAIAAINAAVQMRRINRRSEPVLCLLVLAQVVDADFAERLLEVTLLPLLRMGQSPQIAHALLRSAAIAQARGDHGVARHRARSAIRRFGEVNDRRRLALARRIINTAELAGNEIEPTVPE
ncbi:hypothetical protein AURDEDRAFT_163416 [Auricularia subglabra TFB-10046 SS5]|nr:hypothetical protein AURDEDRAFT_163416 [Auricularia subglabra TFB-10046 SS5]